jgi:3D (Asp-Asp-Asp) domain-containing protein
VASGSSKGARKKVGVTAAGTKAKPGTIAADTSVYPMGTVMYVPGYGYGRVEDRGGAIKGEKIDLYFKKHKDALTWGRQKVNVQVWKGR